MEARPRKPIIKLLIYVRGVGRPELLHNVIQFLTFEHSLNKGGSSTVVG